MRILVTGGTGFLGTALVQRLRASCHEVVAIGSAQADLTHPASLSQFQKAQFDYIYHLAAWTQAGDFCLTHAGEQWILNQQINTNVLAWWKQYQPQAKLIAIGTSCSYAPDLPLTEENYLESSPIESLYTYAMTKRMLLVGLRALAQQFGLRYLYVVPSTLYGPGYHTDGRQMHFIFDLIRKLLLARNSGQPPILWGDGYQQRELIFVDDFLNAVFNLADTLNNDLVNIGSGLQFTIREFASEICKLIDYPETLIQYDTSRYVGARSKVLNIEKLRGLLPAWEQTPLRVGLAHTIEWFRRAFPVFSA